MIIQSPRETKSRAIYKVLLKVLELQEKVKTVGSGYELFHLNMEIKILKAKVDKLKKRLI